MAVFDTEKGFDRAIHNIENASFRTKFGKDMMSMKGKFGIGCISDYEPQPLIIRSHHGTYALATVGKINNADQPVKEGSAFIERNLGEGDDLIIGQPESTQLQAHGDHSVDRADIHRGIDVVLFVLLRGIHLPEP
jgi:hypothetical protein